MKNKKFKLETNTDREFIVYAENIRQAVNKLYDAVRDVGIVIATSEVE